MTPRKFWSAVDVECLQRWYADEDTALIAQVLCRTVSQVHAKAKKMRLAKSHAAKSEAARRSIADPAHPGRQHCFKAGIVPWNTGTKGLTGTAEACRANQFKKGSVPHTWVPIGSLRVIEGRLERKLNDLPGAYTMRWFPVHRTLWESVNGPVPNGHVVAFKPGMKTVELAEITLDRLELLSKAEVMARNTIHNMHPQLADIARLRGNLTRAINRKTKKQDTA